MLAFFENLPFVQRVQGFAIVTIAIFFGTFVVDMLCTGTEEPGPVRQCFFCGVSEDLVAIRLVVLAGDLALKPCSRSSLLSVFRSSVWSS